jgi:hypothetical protein
MSSAIREFQKFLGQSLRHPRFWAVLAAMIVLFSIIGPFGTFERMSLGLRFVYWAFTMIGSWAIAIVSLGIMVGVLRRFDLSLNATMIIGAIVSAAPIALFLRFAIPLFFADGNPNSFWVQYLYALPITLTFSLITNILVNAELGNIASQIDIPDDDENALMSRIPTEKRGPVKYMSAEDHYVKVVTTRGMEMVLMRMADAANAVPHLKGVRVHRSHWVNKDFAVSHNRQNGQPYIVMDDGSEIPVSRSYTKLARSADLI